MAERQIAINLDNRLSYFSRVQYQLPPLRELIRNLTTEDKWKLQIKAAIHVNIDLVNLERKLLKVLHCVIWTLSQLK